MPTPQNQTATDYHYEIEKSSHAHAYLRSSVEKQLARLTNGGDKRIFDLGCGNGSTADWLQGMGYEVSGVDPSESGIKLANKHFSQCDLRVGSCYESLHETFGRFPILISLEVVEHVYAPREFAKCIFTLLQPGGFAIVSTPYHGYLKNLAIAVTGKFDNHFTALWDHGHIKFWSKQTLARLFQETGLEPIEFLRVGRIAPLSKSMIWVFRRPKTV